MSGMYLHFFTFGDKDDDDGDIAKAGGLGLGLHTLEREGAAVA